LVVSKRDDVRQLGADEIGNQELRNGETPARHQCRRPGLLDAFPAIHHQDDPERHEQGKERQLPPGHGADQVGIDSADLTRHQDRDAQRAKSDRGGVGDQAEAGGIHRIEAQTHQHGGRDRHRGAETGGPFEEGAKAETHHQHLQPLILGYRGQGSADNLELPAFHRQFVEEHRGDDDPGDRPLTEQEAVRRGGEGHVRRHPIKPNRHSEGCGDGEGGGDVSLHAEHRKGHEKQQNR
jgi:hypothetical protein